MMQFPITTLLACCLFITQTMAQDLDNILESHHQAAAMEKMQNVETILTRGKNTFSMAGLESAFTIYQSRPDKLRMETDYQGSKVIQTFNGEKGWAYAPVLGMEEPTELQGMELETLMKQVQFESPLWNYADKGSIIEVADLQDDENSFHLLLTTQDGDLQHFYLDRKNYLVKSFKITQIMGGSETEMEVSMEDYKTVKGIPFAVEVVSKMNGQVVTSTRIEKIELNKKMDPALFEKPEVDQ